MTSARLYDAVGLKLAIGTCDSSGRYTELISELPYGRKAGAYRKRAGSRLIRNLDANLLVRRRGGVIVDAHQHGDDFTT